MGMTAKVRIMAEAAEAREVAECLAGMPGWRVIACSEGYANRGADVRSRWYVDLEREPGAVPATEVEDAPALPDASSAVADLLATVRGL